ncbi:MULTISPECIES: ATP-binding protein [unclassified Streptomyces]|uniref:AAA family ATPase n=1 Tax=unclassified Streptomyces TaxID=2593676 RepID=UPI00278BFB12|nr:MULTISPECIES: ATP-binding protein [unclassified Streptomyces]
MPRPRTKHLPRPPAMFDREVEWSDLVAFGTQDAPGATLGVVSGRRRQGKTFLLDSLCQAAGGFYFQALESTEAVSLHELGAALGRFRGTSPLRLESWQEAVDELLLLGAERPVPVVIDEFPYLARQSGALPSVIQAAYGPRRKERLHSRTRLLLCGSAISFMGRLLSGAAPLRGRASLDMVVHSLDFRQAAEFWGITDRRLAALVHAVVGGTPAYRDYAQGDSPDSPADFEPWLMRTVMNPNNALFREARYLLAEEPDMRERSLYAAVVTAIASGNHTRGGITNYVGRSATDLTHVLKVLQGCGLVRAEPDAFRANRNTYRIAEPLLTFHHAVMQPALTHIERHRPETAWLQHKERFASAVLGPHFEELCRQWAVSFAAPETFGGLPAEVRSGVVSDPGGRTAHEVDVAVHGIVGQDTGILLSIGEAKWHREMSGRDLHRLRRILELLAARGVDTSRTRPACYSGAGFTPELREAERRGEVILVDLERLYEGE